MAQYRKDFFELMLTVSPRSRRMEKNIKNGVYMPDALCGIGVVFTVISALFTFGVIMNKMSLTWIVFAVVMLAVSLSMLVEWENDCILYDDDGFTKRSFWGREKHYTYDAVTAYSGRTNAQMFIYTGEKRFEISRFAVGGGGFFKFIEQKKKEKGAKLKKRVGKWDFFNGHIANGEEICICYMLVTLFVIAMGVWMLWYFERTPYRAGGAVWFVPGIGLLVLLYFLFAIKIGRNPRKYRKLVKLFFREKDIIYNP